MSISREVSQAKSAISAITADNLEDQKPKASGQVDDIGGIGRQIVGHAREAVWNDATITAQLAESQTQLATLETTKNDFMTTLATLQRELQEAHNRFQNALTSAEQTFNVTFDNAHNELSGNIQSLEAASEANKALHRQIWDLAS